MTKLRRIAGLAMCSVLLHAKTSWAQSAAETADSVTKRAIALMGGEPTLRGVERVAYQMMTQWQRTNFRTVPYTDQPSYEPHTDVRDYTLPAWRNTREFGRSRIINIIRDSIALTNNTGKEFQP
ncbi:MAG: hypothetical protein IT354_13215, partial [Gemmatimonadaceae bacterium]|nr:hypothetical protein [Gemmatimonadaceae bacterium]